MEIVHVYQKKRADFGRQCNFSDRPATVLAEVIPDESLRKDYIRLDPCDAATQNTREYSEHNVRTALCALRSNCLPLPFCSLPPCTLCFPHLAGQAA